MMTRRNFVQAAGTAALLGAASPASAMFKASHAINPRLLTRAMEAMRQKRHLLADTRVIGIADFSKPSAFNRFFLVDTRTGDARSFQVSHGRGSDPAHHGFVEHFSNEHGSKASSAGSYVTGDFYYGKYGRSLKLRGLDYTNSNAEARSIVIHSAPYAEPGIVNRYGKLGRSEGCFAFSRQSHAAVMSELGRGRFLYCDRV